MPTQNHRYVQDDKGQWWFILKGGGRTRALEQVCAQCGRVFIAYLKRVSCSRVCAAQRLRKPPKPLPTCIQCGVQFKPTGGGQTFCSHGCAATAMHAARRKTTVITDRGLAGENNPRFSQDESGQWWYRVGKAPRTRAYVRTCDRCGRASLRSIFHKSRYCSRRCGVIASVEAGKKTQRAEKSHLWTGGRRKTGAGYVAIYSPEHPSIKVGARKYVLEHRLVMEKMLGRYLTEREFVHHKNGVKDDNRPDNLELWARAHPWGQRADEQRHCPTCTCQG